MMPEINVRTYFPLENYNSLTLSCPCTDWVCRCRWAIFQGIGMKSLNAIMTSFVQFLD